MVSFFTVLHTMVSSLHGLAFCEGMMQHVIRNFAVVIHLNMYNIIHAY